MRDRLDEPLRVAIAGMVKAGKSTLLNAIIGEEVAPTDAGECTRVIIWYRHGATPRITMQLRDGASRSLPIRRIDGRLQIDLIRHVRTEFDLQPSVDPPDRQGP
jgi:GTPase SAR1 family protein